MSDRLAEIRRKWLGEQRRHDVDEPDVMWPCDEVERLRGREAAVQYREEMVEQEEKDGVTVLALYAERDALKTENEWLRAAHPTMAEMQECLQDNVRLAVESHALKAENERLRELLAQVPSHLTPAQCPRCEGLVEEIAAALAQPADDASGERVFAALAGSDEFIPRVHRE